VDGLSLGKEDGGPLNTGVGRFEGFILGDLLKVRVGFMEEELLGVILGSVDGLSLGKEDGGPLNTGVGRFEGLTLGDSLKIIVGFMERESLGLEEGFLLGINVVNDGLDDEIKVGAIVFSYDGEIDGRGVSIEVSYKYTFPVLSNTKSETTIVDPSSEMPTEIPKYPPSPIILYPMIS